MRPRDMNPFWEVKVCREKDFVGYAWFDCIETAAGGCRKVHLNLNIAETKLSGEWLSATIEAGLVHLQKS